MKKQSLPLSFLKEREPQIQWFHDQECTILDVQSDSRKIQPGMLFIAISGTKEQGEEYMEDAIQKGAVAVVAQKYRPLSRPIPFGVTPEPRHALSRITHYLWQEPAKGMRITGITGTNGKTTTSFLIRSILQKASYPTGLLGTTGCYYAEQFFPATHTTPEPVELNEHFARMKSSGIEHVVMEVSSHSLDQGRVAHLDFDFGIFTNLSRDHLDYHLTMEKYLEAKSLLFRSLKENAFAILNYNAPESQYLKQNTRAKCVFFSLQKQKNVAIYAEEIQAPGVKNRFTLVTPNGKVDIILSLPGIYNIENALAAAACAWAEGIPLETIAQGLNSFSGVPGRMELIPWQGNFEVFVDFAHTDQALKKAVLTLKETKPNRLLLVFGCGGDRDRGKRPMMGEIGKLYADYTWITNDNPRTENPESIASEIVKGFADSKNYTLCLDRAKAIEEAIQSAYEGDIVLIAGKGHENVQIVGKDRFPFSDQEVAKNCLEKIYRKRK